VNRLLFQAAAAAGLAVASLGAAAAPIVFSVNPLTGSAANPNDGVRSVIGTAERVLPSFDFATDRFVFDAAAFGLGAHLDFANARAGHLDTAGLDVIVLQDTDNDGNAATPFNAGSAANLIADRLTADGGGFFVYFNSALGVNRLVFSNNLNDRNADLAILARISNPTGAQAVEALPHFAADNFAVSAVPEPGTWALLATGLGLMAWRRRR
jgi:hypothetical protein